MRCIGGQLKTWLQLNVAKSQDYQKLREAIIQCDNATLRWTNTVMLGADPEGNDGVVSMELERAEDKVMEKGSPRSKVTASLKILEERLSRRALAKEMDRKAKKARLIRRSARRVGRQAAWSAKRTPMPRPMLRLGQLHRAQLPPARAPVGNLAR